MTHDTIFASAVKELSRSIRDMAITSPDAAAQFAAALFFSPIKLPARTGQFRSSHPVKEFELTTALGDQVKYYSLGQGPVLVCVHGWGGAGGQFKTFASILADVGYEVVVFDGPAHGEHAKSCTDTLELAHAVSALQAHRGDIHGLIAHSYGGVVGLYAINQLGVSVSKLVCIAMPQPKMLFEKFADLFELSTDVAYALKDCISEKYRALGIDAWNDFNLETLRDIGAAEALLIHDDSDTEVSVAAARSVQEELSGFEHYSTQGLGHYKILASPQVSEKILSFLHIN